MANFIESPRFPDEIAFWAQGGRGFKTTVVETYGGDEYRNAAWSQQRGEWSCQDAYRSENPGSAYNYSSLIKFFRACRGQLYGFRFKDFSDYQATDAGGSGTFVFISGTSWQLYKTYSVSPLSFAQIIQKPVSGTVVITGGSGWSVDYTTGIATGTGTPTSWTGQYDIPCRFGGDVPANMPDSSSGALWDWQNLKIVETRDLG
jgi:uncharacterized protein (TIGR02217 family)